VHARIPRIAANTHVREDGISPRRYLAIQHPSSIHRIPTLIPLLLAFAACSASRSERPARRFVVVAQPEHDDATVVVDAPSPAAARARLLTDFDATDGPANLVGRAPWSTVAILAADEPDTDAPRTPRTFVRTGPGELRLDVRLAAGRAGAHAGGSFDSGHARAMIEVRIEDPGTLGARFRLALFVDERPGGAPPRDITPRYLRSTLPAGRYRAGLDVPARGARWLVGAVVVDREGRATAHGWSSAIALRRAWL
jgi:hypothetical protein